MTDNLSSPALAFFERRPIVGIMGSIASVIAIPLAVIFYMQGQAHRELVYTVHPVRTVLAEAGEPGAMRVIFDGQEVREADVVSMRIAIWNQGDRPVHSGEVLEPIAIAFQQPVRLLRTSVSAVSRDVVNFSVEGDSAQRSAGVVPVSFRILEQGDGATVDIVYAGPRDTEVVVSGTIEGQRQIRALQSGARIRTPGEQLVKVRSERYTALMLNAFTALMIFAMLLFLRHFRAQAAPEVTGSRYERIFEIVSWAVAIILIVMVVVLWPTIAVGPPFEF